MREKLIELLETHCDYAGHVDCKEDCTKCLADHLIANGVTLLDRESKLEKAMERLGSFGRLFVAYTGDPRGPIGRVGWPGGDTAPDPVQRLEAEAKAFGLLTDVDGGRWYPVPEDVLEDLLNLAQEKSPKA